MALVSPRARSSSTAPEKGDMRAKGESYQGAGAVGRGRGHGFLFRVSMGPRTIAAVDANEPLSGEPMPDAVKRQALKANGWIAIALAVGVGNLFVSGLLERMGQWKAADYFIAFLWTAFVGMLVHGATLRWGLRSALAKLSAQASRLVPYRMKECQTLVWYNRHTGHIYSVGAFTCPIDNTAFNFSDNGRGGAHWHCEKRHDVTMPHTPGDSGSALGWYQNHVDHGWRIQDNAPVPGIEP